MKPREYYRLTWREYVLMHDGYVRQSSFKWEHTRAILYGLCAVNRDPKKPFPAIQKFMPLPTDADNVIDEYSEGQRLKDRLAEHKERRRKEKELQQKQMLEKRDVKKFLNK